MFFLGIKGFFFPQFSTKQNCNLQVYPLFSVKHKLKFSLIRSDTICNNDICFCLLSVWNGFYILVNKLHFYGTLMTP